ncbi:hypothetical protein [Halorubrum ezzemoulense]|uniref:hypothetical protein n=1 Tax=Halorubrum ezzemoulense TaxID=337243 RepID=UPI00232F1363|nr:hypothetical protein [Halorubrum ezzemoulense]MDB9251636.1 hypothetical protein [Halorubrum ezzemoulense]MDB9256045.1 hypothetical protein [Halorubrum ezzemoulense]MDB9276756.1 hypothetical protein [Halorubrum ezzemoulense]
MRFSRDRRGQSVVVGTVILFGFLIVALGIFQIQVVPTENANVEFEHSQQVEDDFGDLRNDVLRAGSTGSTGSTQVRLGTRYPARTFFINPPSVSGSLETEPTGPIRVLNVTVGDGAHQNARDFWNTSPSFETRSLRYDAEYNEFDGAPELVYEHSVVAAEFDDAVLLRTGQTVVSEEGISLTALTGSVSETGVVPRSVDPRAVSASDTTVPLEPRGGQITLELPTAVGNASALAERWNGALPAGATATRNATGEAINVTLANGSDPYRLALSEVSLDASGETKPAYVVPVGPQNVALDDTVTVEVRDRYNNPVPDATVSIVGDGRENTTNDDGRVFFEANRTSITATINGTEPQPYENVSFDASADAPTTGVNRIYDVEWDEIDPVQIEEGTTDGELDISVSDSASNAPIDDAAVDVAFTPLGNVNGVPSFDEPSETDADGRTTVRNFNTNGANAGDNFTFYASAGDDVDRVRVEVVAQGTPTRLYPDTFTVNEGEIRDFSNIQDENGNFAVLDRTTPGGPFDIETITQSVPTGDYTLDLGLGEVDPQGNGNIGVSVIANDTGTTLNSTTIDGDDSDSVVTLNLGTIDPEQDIIVQYTASGQNDDLQVDYQRLVRQ